MKLLTIKFKTSSMKSLPTQRRTKEKGIMERKKSSVHTVGRASTLNMPTWRRKTWWSYFSSWEKSHQSFGNLLEKRLARSRTTTWKRSCSHGKHFEVQISLDIFWSFESHDGWKRLFLIFGDQKIHSHPHGRWLHNHIWRIRYCRSWGWLFFQCSVCTISCIKPPKCLSNDTYGSAQESLL